MSVATHRCDNGSTLVLTLVGRFDFSIHQEFRRAYESQLEAPLRYQLDLAQVDYLDSSALGMLLLLRDYAGGDQATIELKNCRPDVLKVLTISKFEQLFTLA